MKNFLRLSGIIALLAVSYLFILLAAFVRDARKEIAVLNNKADTLTSQVGEITGDINAQLSQMNSIVTTAVSGLDKAEAQLLKQTGDLEISASTSLAVLDSLTTNLNHSVSMTQPVIKSADALLANPENEKVVRDVRINLALAGETMSHIRTVADTAALEAPAMAKSADSIAVSVAGVTSDVHGLTSDLRKPRPWWKKTISFITDAAGIARYF